MSKELTTKEQQNLEILAHIEPVVDAGFNKDRFAKMTLITLADNPSLAKASKNSLYKELVQLARAGLVPDGKEAALVPFFNKQKKMYEATAMPMVAGLIKNARKSGEVKSLGAFLVHKNDDFVIERDSEGQRFSHKPVNFGDRGELVGVYAVAYLENGMTELETMTMDELAAVESASRAGNSPWKGKFRTEMMRKSVLRRLLKRLPSTGHLDELISMDNRFFSFDKKDEAPREERTLSERIKEKQGDIPAEAEVVEPAAEEPPPPPEEGSPPEDLDLPI